MKASPVAKRLAGDLGLDIAGVRGSGPGGRVVKRDIEMAAQAAAAAPTVPVAAPAPGDDFVDIPLTQMRKTVARRLTGSLGPVPHFFLTVDIDMTRALAARVRVNALLEARGAKASVNDLIIKAAAAAPDPPSGVQRLVAGRPYSAASAACTWAWRSRFPTA